MGRGRQKAKQTKVARELKYRPISTDFASLEEELRTSSGGEIPPAYADLADEYAHEDHGFDDEMDESNEYEAYLPDDEDE
ncbi:MAG: DUF3073 domain-containing protein [Propionibacteriaceae bacterium]|jgi:ppGpp synthetase/RelA/SpoT-type nucleotidyltranferase|nr:DUF3073 domain-containing protein [Propionibacteriaceae bacterium]